MKKLRWFCLALCIGTIFAGCSRSGAVSDKQEAEENVSMGEEYHFPEKYEKTSDSGKVKFNCQLEIPENMKQSSRMARWAVRKPRIAVERPMVYWAQPRMGGTPMPPPTSR